MEGVEERLAGAWKAGGGLKGEGAVLVEGAGVGYEFVGIGGCGASAAGVLACWTTEGSGVGATSFVLLFFASCPIPLATASPSSSRPRFPLGLVLTDKDASPVGVPIAVVVVESISSLTSSAWLLGADGMGATETTGRETGGRGVGAVALVGVPVVEVFSAFCRSYLSAASK
mgnify:CR=1 FL=1